MPGAGTHRIVDHHDRQRADIVAIALDQVHLRDLFVQRAADRGHAQWVDFEGIGFFVAHALGAGIAVAIMAIDAMIDLGQYLALIVTPIGQLKSVPAAAVFQSRPSMP